MATLRIVKPDLAREVRRRTFLCAAFVHSVVQYFTVATPTLRAVLGLGGSRRVQRPIRSR